MRRSSRNIVWGSAAGLVILYLLLLIPAADPPTPETASQGAFLWNRDQFWKSLETQFQEARGVGCEALDGRVDGSLARAGQLVEAMTQESLEPADPKFDSLEDEIFRLAPMIAACPEHLPDYIALFTRTREMTKAQSVRWDMESPAARQRLYRLLYGGRAAVEEAMLQAPAGAVPALVRGRDEPSQTPAANILGVAVHSGDILVSRGGAATSALIARGNDYPGNFSHIALVHVHRKTHAVSVIESLIEKGVTVNSFEDYLAGKKLRVMLLRLRADLPQLRAEPTLPHFAASLVWANAQARHIPYDFEMDYRDHNKQFCSEVVSAPYQALGVNLWMGFSHISSPGVAAWLAAFGVRHFQTQEPADLEYDPQLCVVAEWRNPETLFKDHADNAVIDVMLEEAEAGATLRYSRPLLPLARCAKAYSVALNSLGRAGPIPEGMSATAALRSERFSQTHAAINQRLLVRAAEFKRQHGYTAPYWELVRLARQAKADIRTQL